MDPLVIYPALFFAALSFLVALHHLYVHSQKPSDRARDESCAVCCYLQPSDMANHEIWVVSLLSVAATWLLAASVLR